MSQNHPQLKETKDLNYFSLCALNLFNTRVSQFCVEELSYWNNELFHDILIYWDAPVVYFIILVGDQNIFKLQLYNEYGLKVHTLRLWIWGYSHQNWRERLKELQLFNILNKCSKVDWTALQCTYGRWPKTYCKSNPGPLKVKGGIIMQWPSPIS